jgi:hypothetical protein
MERAIVMKKFPLKAWSSNDAFARPLSYIADRAMDTALDVMLLGEVEQANRINEVIDFSRS